MAYKYDLSIYGHTTLISHKTSYYCIYCVHSPLFSTGLCYIYILVVGTTVLPMFCNHKIVLFTFIYG